MAADDSKGKRLLSFQDNLFILTKKNFEIEFKIKITHSIRRFEAIVTSFSRIYCELTLATNLYKSNLNDNESGKLNKYFSTDGIRLCV